MIDLLYQSIVTSLIASDTSSALTLLQDNQNLFLDPIEGASLHAQALYSAIKSTNVAVLKALLKVPVLSDIAFYKFCGHSPLSFAIEEGKTELVPILLSTTDKNFALHLAVKLNLEKTKDFLLKSCIFSQRLLKFLGLS